jgi:molybdopterin-guanine dinucleotide biosynthesis protein A
MVSVILSGGGNTRFPLLKGFIEVSGKRLIESNLELLRGITGEVVISTNAPEHYFYLGVPLIGDVKGPAGPMSGIYSPLYCTGADEVFVTACDMPYLNSELISYIISNRGKEATVPVFGGRPEPLLAVYTSGLLETMKRLINEGMTSITHMLKEIDVKYIGEEEVKRIDREGRSFININTPEDYERAF